MTKPKPGAKRGRPSKSKDEREPATPKTRKLGSGRTRKPLSQHPQRYGVPALDAAAMLGFSERQAPQAWLALAIGKPHATRTDAIAVDMPLDEFNKAADNWRNLARWYTSPSDLLWRAAIAQAILFAVKMGRAGEEAILNRAAAVGESHWARNHLLPSIPQSGVSVGESRDFIARIFSEIFLSQLANDNCCSE